jgi:predicted TIM-barrel fold metal-dependent hydrolase
MTKRRPSDYFRDNVWIGASFPGPGEAGRFEEIGVDKVMWGSDYPHDEGTYPNTRASLRAAFSGWGEADVRRVLAGNIASVYGFDLGALAPIAERVGPRVDEVAA